MSQDNVETCASSLSMLRSRPRKMRLPGRLWVIADGATCELFLVRPRHAFGPPSWRSDCGASPFASVSGPPSLPQPSASQAVVEPILNFDHCA
jgi:hypothetical protein